MAKANEKVEVISRVGSPFRGCRRNFEGTEGRNLVSEWVNGHWVEE
jgi:hypothetical protein